MKKLKLKFDGMEGMLTKDQMKSIKGGYGSSYGGSNNKCCWYKDCTVCSTCANGTQCSYGFLCSC
ncbi:hypothetical protein [Mucilaginibacter galii]|uniref:hypothetical protein n=1 Tax=Mucilaginibacter galii TaxID=2005073 RepID=UPI00166D4776|nr:hypothetical protein [Mucilaginibacter galii]